MALLLAGVAPVACGPATEFRTAAPADAQRLDLLAAPSGVPFAATGRARFVSEDSEVEGDLEVRVAPPDRAWIEIRSRALFGMVGERVVASLPGDGYLVVQEERAARLDRAPFDSTQLAAICPGGDAPSFLALARGRLPAGLLRGATATRVSGSATVGQFALDLGAPQGGGTLLLRLEGDRLQELEWRVGGERRVWIRYERYREVGNEAVPTRLSLEAPGAGIRADLELRELSARPGFEAGDFEVGRSWNPAQRRGVDDG